MGQVREERGERFRRERYEDRYFFVFYCPSLHDSPEKLVSVKLKDIREKCHIKILNFQIVSQIKHELL